MDERLLADRYRVEQDLGGTMGEVYLATDTELDRKVVVKLLRADANRDRFEREARAAASLSHPNIVNLYTYGEFEGRPYMVLEYLPGGTLEDLLASGAALPDAETQRISNDIAAGLAHAHARGLVHRDLKPANILFDDEGRAKIADFGIARMADSGTLTEAGTLVGTAAYMSPEQAQGLAATPASDVYAFGVILFRMLTGELPFSGPSTMELVAQHVNAEPPAVVDLRPDAPPQLAALTEAALAKDPAARPPDGAALAAELSGATAATMVLPATAATAATVAATARPPRARRGRPPVTTMLAAVVLVVLIAGGVALAFALTQTGSGPPVPAGAATKTNRHHHKKRHHTTSAATTTTAPTTAPATTAPTTTHRTTTHRTTTHAATTTTPPPATTVITTVATTAPVTTVPTTTAATTTVPPGPP